MSKPNQQVTEAQAKKRRLRQRVQREPEVADSPSPKAAPHEKTVGPGAVSLGRSQVSPLRRTKEAGRGGNGGQLNLAFDAAMLFEGGTVEAQAEVLQRLDGTQRQKAIQQIGEVQGNRHVQRVVTAYDGRKGDNGGSAKKGVSSAGRVQTKLEVSEPGDEYEQEADAVAEQVMLMPAAPPADEAPVGGDNGGNGSSGGELSLWDLVGRDMGLAMLFEGETAGSSVGRKANRCTGGDCVAEAALLKPNVQRQRQEGKAGGALHRQRKPNRCATPDCRGEAALLKQGARRWAGQEATSEVAPDLEERVRALQGRGAPLPEGERAFFEPRLGMDLSQVRIHVDGEAADLSQELGARAFALGGDIAFGEGEFRPGTEGGRRLMAHELAHVVQQGAAEPLEGAPSADERAGQEGQPAEGEGQAAAEKEAGKGAGEAAEVQEGKAAQAEGQQMPLREGMFDPVMEEEPLVPMEGASGAEAYAEGQKEALERALSERAEPLAAAHDALEGAAPGEAAAILRGQAAQVTPAEVRLPLGQPTRAEGQGEAEPRVAQEVVEKVREGTEHPQTVKEAEADGFQALSSQAVENRVVPSGGMVEQAGVTVPEGAAGEANLAQNPAFESMTYKQRSGVGRRGLTDAGARPNLDVSRGYRSVELGQQRAAAGMQVGAQAAETEAIAWADYGQHGIYPTEEGRGVAMEGEAGDAGVAGSLAAAAEFVEEVVEAEAGATDVENDPDALCREDWEKRQEELEEEEAALEEERESLEDEEEEHEVGEKRIDQEQKGTDAQALALRQQGAEQEREGQELRDEQLALNARRRELARQEKEAEGGNPALAAQKAQLEARGAQLRGQKVRLKQAGRRRTYRQKQTRAQEVGLREKEDRQETYEEGLEERFASHEERDAWLEEAWRALEEEMAAGCQRGKGGGGGGGGGGVADALAADEEALAAQAAALEKERQELEARRALLAEQVEYDAAAVMATAVAENDALLASFANLSTMIDAEAQADIAKILADAETESKAILAQAESDAEARQKQGEMDAEQAIREAQAAAADVAEGEDPGPIIAWGQRRARQILATMQSDVNKIIEKGQQEVEKRLQEAEVAAGVRTEVAATDQDVLAQDTADESVAIADQASTDVGVVVDGGVEELDAEIAASDARVTTIVEEELPGTAALEAGGSDYYALATSGYWADGYGVEEPVAEPPVYASVPPEYMEYVYGSGSVSADVVEEPGAEVAEGTGQPSYYPYYMYGSGSASADLVNEPETEVTTRNGYPSGYPDYTYDEGDASVVVVEEPEGDGPGEEDPVAQANLQIQDAWGGLTDEQRENMTAEEQAALLLASVQGVEALQVPEPYRPTTSMEAQWYYSQPHEPPAMNQDQVRIMVDAVQNIEGLPEEVRTQVIWQAAGFDSQETLQALNGVAQTTTMSPVQQADALLTTLQNQPGFENLPPAERAEAMYQIVVLQMPSVPERIKGAVALTCMNALEEEVVAGLNEAFASGDTERISDYRSDVNSLAFMHEFIGKDFINRTVGLKPDEINDQLEALESELAEFRQLGGPDSTASDWTPAGLAEISENTGFLIPEDLPAMPTEALQGLRGVSEEDWATDIMISGKIPEEAFQFDLDQIQAEIGVFSQGHEFAAQLSTDQAQVTVAALQSSDTFNSLSPTQQALAATMWIEQLPGLSWEARGIATTAILDGINADIMSQVVDIVVETGVQSDEGLDDFKNLVLELAQVNSVYAVAAPAYVSQFAGYSPEMAEKYASDLSDQIAEGRNAVELLYFTGLDRRDALGGFDDYLEFKGMEDHGNQNVSPLLEAMAIFGASYEQMSALIPEFRTESSYRQTIASAGMGLDSIDVLSQTLWLEVPEDRLLTDPTFDAGMMARQAYQSLDSGNEAQFFELIDELDPAELQATFDAFTRYSPKRIDEWNLSEEEEARLQAIIQGNVALSDAIAVEIAIDQSNPEALANLLRNRTPEDIADIERLYQGRYDGSLKDHLEDAFGDTDTDRIEALLAGDTATADAIAIAQAGYDFEAIAEIYERNRQEVIEETRYEFLTTAELEERIRERNQGIDEAYLDYTGESLDQRLSSEVYFDQVGMAGATPSITDLAYRDLVLALSDYDPARVDAARLTLAAETGDDEAKLDILRSQYDRAREEVNRDQLAAFYQQIQSSGGSSTPEEVLQAWHSVLGAASPDYMAYLDQLAQDVADENMQGFLGAYEGRLGEYNARGIYTNEIAMSAGLGNMLLPDGEDGLFPAFLSWHDPVLEELAGRLIETSGNLPREEELYYAVLRKDEDVINAILYSGANPGDLAQEYAQCLIDKGVTDEIDIEALRNDLEGALKDDDRADAMATLQEGELTPEAQLRILQRRVEHEQDDGWASGFLDWSGLQERSLMSNSLFETEAAYYRWQMAEENLPDTEVARQAYTLFEQAMGRTEFDIEQHRYAEDVLSNTVGNVTATVVGIGATIAIVLIVPGAAPIIVAAASSAAGSIASIAAQSLMEGGAYEEEILDDASEALVNLGISVLTAGMGDRLPVPSLVGEIAEEGTASVLNTVLTLPPEQWGDALKSLPMDVLVELVVGQTLEIGLEEIQMRRQMGRGANFADFHRNVVELDNGMGTVTTATTPDGNVRSVLQLGDGTTLRIAPELARVLPDQPELFAFLQTHAELLAPGQPNFDLALSQRLLQPEIAQILSQNPNLVNISDDPIAVADIAALSANVPALQGTPEEIAAMFHFGSGTDVDDLQIAGERQQWYIRNGFPYIEGYEWYARRDADGDMVYRPRRRANLDSESITDPALRQIFENQDSTWDVQQGAFTYNDENGRPASYRPPDPVTGAPGIRTEQVMLAGTLVTQVTMITPDGTPVLRQINDASGRPLRTETLDSAGEVINRTGVSVEEYNSFPESVQQRIREGTIPPEELESNLNIVRAFQSEMGDYGDLFNAVFEAGTPEARLEASNALLAQIAPPVALLGNTEGGLQSVRAWLIGALEAQVGATGIDTSQYTDAINAADNPLDVLALYRNASDVFVGELKGFTPTFNDPVGQAMIRDLMATKGISESQAMANIELINQTTAGFEGAVTPEAFNAALVDLEVALNNPDMDLSPAFREEVRTQFLEPYQNATPEMQAYMREMYLEGGFLPSHAIGLKAFSENVDMTMAFRQADTAAGLWGLMGVPGKPMGWGLSAELLAVGARDAGILDNIVEIAQTDPQIAERVNAYREAYPHKSEEDWIFMAIGESTGGARLTSFNEGPFASTVYNPMLSALHQPALVRSDYDLATLVWNGQALTDAQTVALVPFIDAAATGRFQEPFGPEDLADLMDAVASGDDATIRRIQTDHLGPGYVPQEVLHSGWLTYYKPGTDQRLLDSNPGPLSVIAPGGFATVPQEANANWFRDVTTPDNPGPVRWPAHWGGDTMPWESTDFRNEPTVRPIVEPDGSTTVDVATPEGDAIRFNTARDEFVFESERSTTTLRFGDGSEVITDVYGRALVLRGPDGSVTVRNNDGSLTRVGPSGERTSVTLDDDGTVTVYIPTGLLRVLEPIDEEYEEELAESQALRDRYAAIQQETDPLKKLGMIEELWNELGP